MSSLPTPLRKQLAAAIQRARTVAETGARNALQALAVHEADPYRHMSDAQRELRRKLRAQARQLGDSESKTQRGTLDIAHLVEKLAYDQWHRLLFARYLLENNLLISPAHQVSVSLDDCEELAPSEGLKDAWAVAARYAAKELPEIFRADDPAGAVDLPLEDRSSLVGLVIGLPAALFIASDSLGWCYQFWQAEKKDAVNAAGAKIGADELPSVTQLFTEDYMVDFLLDNTLGAWHAGKVLAANPHLADSASGEEELRRSVALPGCGWHYLRFVREEAGKWTPAAGTFDSWPTKAAEIKALDPCMGSGHFVVAMFERLVALRAAEEALEEVTAVAAVIRDNLFGLEIDPRCTQIGAFNLALTAWRRIGHCKLPAMNLACSGIAPNTREADWLAIAGDDEKLRNGMGRLYRLFQQAAALGSLINPRADEGNLLVAAFNELQPLLEIALGRENENDTARELAVAARGVAKAAEILTGQFTLVATNVPYLGRGKQDEILKAYCARVYPNAKAELATCFIDRSLQFCKSGGSIAIVSPQNWFFLGSYRKFRESLLRNQSWSSVVLLGANAFRDMNWWAATTGLATITKRAPTPGLAFAGFETSGIKEPTEKAAFLTSGVIPRTNTAGNTSDDGFSSMQIEGPVALSQQDQAKNPDSRIVVRRHRATSLIRDFAVAHHGLTTGDSERMQLSVWELDQLRPEWMPFCGSCDSTSHYSGRNNILRWHDGSGPIDDLLGARKDGQLAWGHSGILIRQMRHLPCTIYTGEPFDNNTAVLVPHDAGHLAPMWAYLSSPEYLRELRRIDQKVSVTSATLAKVPFDLAHWQKVAEERYPQGLPKPRSSDPTQWLFNGHPAGADQPLHVAVARLLGYRWPRQNGSSFLGCPALESDGLETLADDDGIVPINPIKGEGAAAERLRNLLARAYGDDWDASVEEGLLAQVEYLGSSLEDWLRTGFFEQHCALFHQRPFIWHIWDGRKDGFSALVNYHKLNHANLERLTFAYVGDWIRRQQAAVEAGESGSDARLHAARQLQVRLKLILDGEPPFDLFVRWKPLSQQAIGWYPDIDDGVRINIRPFMAQDIPGGKKGAGILRAKPNISWGPKADRGNEPFRDKKEFPWFWGWDGQATDFAGIGTKPDGNRWNACHYTNAFKQRAREEESKK